MISRSCFMGNKKQWLAGGKFLALLLLLGSSQWLLGEDGKVFLSWWLAMVVLGIVVFPVTGQLFSRFRDKGWIVAKVLGTAGAGFLTWLLVCCQILPFTGMSCVLLTGVLALCCWSLWLWQRRKKKTNRRKCEIISLESINGMLDGELVFTLFFLLWTYAAGFRPAAYGTEKFMDYGFMMAMMRSRELPAKDLWYAGETLNYYYGGQYFAV